MRVSVLAKDTFCLEELFLGGWVGWSGCIGKFLGGLSGLGRARFSELALPALSQLSRRRAREMALTSTFVPRESFYRPMSF